MGKEKSGMLVREIMGGGVYWGMGQKDRMIIFVLVDNRYSVKKAKQ